jgi:hypothetical protein
MARDVDRVGQIKSNLALISGLAGLAFGVAAYARTPTNDPGVKSSTIPYQGFLELNGVPLNTPQNFAFALFDDATAGTMVWGPETHVDVPVTAGAFVVNLGDTVDMGATALAGNRWVEVTVGGQPLMGRQMLGSAAFARRGSPGQDFAVDGDSTVGGALAAGGAVSTPAVVIANKWRLADTGDAWLKLNNAAGSGVSGGIWADDFNANQSVSATDITARGDVVAAANHTGACQNIAVNITGAVPTDDTTSGVAVTNCPDGYFLSGITTKHYQEGTNFRDRYINNIRCCQL